MLTLSASVSRNRACRLYHLISISCCLKMSRKVCIAPDKLLLMSTHNIYFHTEVRKILCGYPLLSGAMILTLVMPASVAQLDAPSDWRPGGCGFNPRRGRQHSFVEIDHEIFSTVILSLPLIQEGQLSVSGERMCTILVNCLED